MARRKESGIEIVASMPWPVGVVLGLIAYIGIRYGIGWYLSSLNNPVMQAMGKQLSAGAYAPFAWIVLAMFWIAALVSYFKSRHRKQLLETQTGLDSIRALSWREFEMLVGEAFHRQGYTVEETGLGGADGGIDLILRKDGKATLVQCKQWRTRQVTVKVVREMYGLLAHHGAAAVKIVAIGDYTADAQRFAQGKAIELIHGEMLLAMVQEGQATSSTKTATTANKPAGMTPPDPTTSTNPVCPKCG